MAIKEEAYEKIKSLVERFEEQIDSYRRTDYNEAQTRKDFIDPFWKALGWDMDNESCYSESYREVIYEDKVKVAGALKAPDYSFRLPGGKRLFFLEAKKPSIAIKDNIEPAYQIRRYGWSAKMAISILSDFEEFSIYDCTIKPKDTDKASTARIKYLRHTEYLDDFDFIWDTFSKESVLKGSFDRYITGDKNKKGTSTVDKEFLNSLDKWRVELARNIALRNKDLSEDELNFIVQNTIDRIIFLRIAEDRSVEPYGQLQSVLKDDNFYQSMFQVFNIADQKYNSGLFDFDKDKLSSKIIIENRVLKSIISELYYPLCPYEFSVLSVEILGSAYEQFLGKQITLSPSGRATIEEKPEVRKAGGVYYTPQYIVEYIVENTVGKIIKNMTPDEVSKIKIADPACGSGSFLIGAYQYLLDWHRDYYTQKSKGKIESKGRKTDVLTPAGELTTAEKKRILINNIYGVDLDSNAVEVTKLSLLLKCMEGETKASIQTQTELFHSRVLPSLDNNIKSGNSLIDLDYYENELDFGEERKVKPFSWEKSFPEVFKEGGFDCIIGNPPYVKEYTSREIFEQIKKSHLKKYYQGKMDVWYFFACYGIDILKSNGLLGFIVPNNWVTNAGASILRNKILDDSTIANIIDFGAYMVFDTANIQTMVLIVQKKQMESYSFDYRRLEASKPDIAIISDILKKKYQTGWVFFEPIVKQIELKDRFLVFGDAKTDEVLFNIQKKKNFILNKTNEVGQGIVAPQDCLNTAGEKALNFEFPKGSGIFVINNSELDTLNPSDIEKRLIKPYYTSEQLSKYFASSKNNSWIIYTNSSFKNTRNIKEYPNIKKHLDKYKKIITSDNKPYGLHRSRDEKYFIGEKIISTRKCAEPTFTYVDFDCYVSQTFFIIKTERINQKYLIALLNSKLVAFWLKHKGKMQGIQYQVDKEPLLEIPIFDTPNNQIKAELIKLVDKILQLKLELQTETLPIRIEQLKQRIDYTEDKINEIVYKLYELTDEEIDLIEKGI